jgi:hypothetical protein
MTSDEHYESARTRARDAVGDSADALGDAIDRYARPVAVELTLRDEWLALGCPALATGGSHGAIVVAHPLLDSMRRASQAAHRLGEPLGLVKAAKSNLHPNLSPDRKASIRDRKPASAGRHLTIAKP